jgi:hypothetical protein
MKRVVINRLDQTPTETEMEQARVQIDILNAPKHEHRFLYDGYSSVRDAHIYVCECSDVKEINRREYIKNQQKIILEEHSSGHVIKVGEDPWVCVCGEVLPSGAAWSEHSSEMDN